MKKNIIIIPPMHILPKYPLIGSGKISRKVFIKSIRKKKSFVNLFKSKINYFPGPISKKIASKPIPFQTSAAKIIFYHWNNLGHPLVHHRPELNKTTAVAVGRINKNIKSCGKEKILYAIDLLSNTFGAQWFKFRIVFAKRKISLSDFFRFGKSEIARLNKQFPDMPISWFKECLKGEQYLKNKYNVRIKDKHSAITKRLISIWEEYLKYDIINAGDKNQLVLCSKKIWEFSKKNQIDCFVLIDMINNMLNQTKNFKPKHAGYLVNNIFWERQIPNELIRSNLILDRSKIKI